MGRDSSNRWQVITVVGSPGSGKTYFLRKGILDDYYKGQSVMVTYGEGSTIIDDGTGDALVAFARQLVDANCKDKGKVDMKRITCWSVVVEAFRMHLKLADDKQLIVCIDEFALLRAHLKNIYEGDPHQADKAFYRWKALRISACRHQAHCTNEDGVPDIRFVWTCVTNAFDYELQERPAYRRIAAVPVHNLGEDDAWKVLGNTLQQEVEKSAELQWAFQMCSGHPRAIVAGFMAHYKLVEDNVANGHLRLLDKIMEACGLTEEHHPLVEDNIHSAILGGVSYPKSYSLREQGVLQTVGYESECINPSLVHSWASKETGAPAVRKLKKCIRDYFGADNLTDPKMFERQVLAFEALIHMVYADCKENLNKNYEKCFDRYFATAFVGNDLRSESIVPCKDVSISEHKSLEDFTSEELYNELHKGRRIYSTCDSKAGVDILIPFFVSGWGKDTLHLLCFQNKQVGDIGKGKKKAGNVSIAAVEEMQTWCEKESKDAITVHPLVLSTYEPRTTWPGTANGVWFTRETMTKWIGRLGGVRLNFRKRKCKAKGEKQDGKKKSKKTKG